jgi:hypothetical protein
MERPLRILYLGAVYLRRDPIPFLRALAALRQRFDEELDID